MAVVQSCQELRGRICALGAKILQADPEEVNFDGEFVFTDEEHKVSLKDIAIQGTCGNSQELQVTRTYSSPVSPPPFMVGMAEVEVDKETGSTKVIDYVQWWTAEHPLTRIWYGCRRKEELHRELEWLSMRIFSIMKKALSATIPLCSIRFRPVLISEISG